MGILNFVKYRQSKLNLQNSKIYIILPINTYIFYSALK
jgi:hypothetical protein